MIKSKADDGTFTVTAMYSLLAARCVSMFSFSCYGAGESLQHAQLNKLDALIEKAGIKKSDHVLEIGCGWGSMAIHAVQVCSQPRQTVLLCMRATHHCG